MLYLGRKWHSLFCGVGGVNKKNTLTQIVEKQSRSPKWESEMTVPGEIDTLRSAWRNLPSKDTVFTHFVFMRLVTCLEVASRLAVKRLIDHGDPYAERARPLIGQAKIDYDYLLNLQGKKITIGEIVGHLVQINSFSAILSVLKTLDVEFSKDIRNVKDRFGIELFDRPDQPIIKDFDAMSASIQRLFEIRHILTHELPRNVPYAESEVEPMMDFVKSFLRALSERVDFLLHGVAPLTQLEMNQEAALLQVAARKEVEHAVTLLRATGKFKPEILDIAQERWLAHAYADADLVASQVEGGSMYPMIHASVMAGRFDSRVEVLNNWTSQEEGDFS